MVKYNGETYIIPKEFEEEIRADERAKFAEWLYENYIVNDNHNEEVSTEDLLWEYTNK